MINKGKGTQKVKQLFVTQVQLCKALAMTTDEVNALVANGTISKTTRGFDLYHAFPAVVSVVRRQAAGTIAVDQDTGEVQDAQQAAAALRLVQASVIETRNAVAAGVLVPVSKIDKFIGDAIISVKSKFENSGRGSVMAIALGGDKAKMQQVNERARQVLRWMIAVADEMKAEVEREKAGQPRKNTPPPLPEI